MEQPFCRQCGKTFDEGFKLCPYDGSELVIRSEDSMAGQVFDGRYRIEHKLGEGGMGAVYKATQLSTDKAVAIKVVSDRLTENPATVRRFQREVRLQTKLSHPNIVSVIDFSKSPTGQYYFVMEYVEGHSLRNLVLNEGKVSLRNFRILAPQICDGLEYAHHKGIIHRDLKGDNIIVATVGHQRVVKILDFGLAKAIQYDEATNNESELTLRGRVLGTPAYMSPEQAKGETDKIDYRTDIYSLGVIFYQMLSGQLPFRSDTPWGFMHKHIAESPPPLITDNRYIPEKLNAIIMKCLEKDQENRFSSALEIKLQLEQEAAEAKNGATMEASASYYDSLKNAKTIGGVPKVAVISIAAVVLIVSGAIIWGLTGNNTERHSTQVATTPKAAAQARTEARKPEATPAKPKPDQSSKVADRKNEEVNLLLSEAREDLSANRLTAPEGKNALEKYKAALVLDPGSDEAKKGMENIMDRYLKMADKAIGEGNFDEAGEYIEKAESVLPDAGQVKTARAKLKTAKSRAQAPPAPVAQQPPPEQVANTAGQDTKDIKETGRGDKKQGAFNRYVELAENALAIGDTAKAGEFLDKADEISPNSKKVAAVRAKLGKIKAKPAQPAKTTQAQPKSSNRQVGVVDSVNDKWGFVVVHVNRESHLEPGDKLTLTDDHGRQRVLNIKKIHGDKASAIPSGGVEGISPGLKVVK